MDCRFLGHCSSYETKETCLTHAQHARPSASPLLLACDWGYNIFGSQECRADFSRRYTTLCPPMVKFIIAGLIKGEDASKTLNHATTFCSNSSVLACRFLVVGHSERDVRHLKAYRRRTNLEAMTILRDTSVHTGRVAGIAAARNKMLRWIRHNGRDAHYVAVADLDGVATFQPNRELLTVLDTASLWDVVSFTSRHYYDLWALRCRGKQDNCWASTPHTCKRRLFTCLDDVPPTGFVDVDSAFNGLAIYRTSALLSGCRYDESESDCEHVSFHRCLKRQGFRILLSGTQHAIDEAAVRGHLAVTA